ncbi:unnamed protein product [Polarella glacialis]|uniref:Uncharacterized protein n=1 Tax=Polarella glacialis TaxID=89957 RepID=A0A813I204_POLGL|nr:unnamed protein product [Polarella glacialis]
MGLAETPSGDLLVADTDNSRIQLCPAWRQDISSNPSGPCSTVAGSPDGIPGWEANRLRTPYTVVLGKVNGSSYSFYVVDSLNHRVQLFRSGSLDGVTVVGGPGVGSPTYNGTGELEFPTGGTFDEARGWLYVADTGHHRIVRYGVDSTGAIVGLGVTVAGSPNQAGSTLRLLDNPSSISFENYAQRLYIADTRNSRVMSWDVSFEGVAAQAAALAFAGGRRLDPEERELSEENVITTSTMTTTKGESVVVEMSGLKGRPYGVMRNQGATYIADSDGCAIVKVLDGQSVTVVGGLCGGSLSQLSFPGGLLVSYDGAIIIADSGNSRVLRVGPEPGKASLQCPLGGPCSVTLRGGNPYHSHALAVVALSDNSTCGGKCSVSGISGPMWSSGKNPSSPLLNDMVFDFGISSYGKTMTNYLLCWGKQGNINEMEGGNCSSFPYTIGALRLLPYVEGQDGSTNECVKGTNCLITLRGYGIPAGFMVSIPPGSQPPDGISCGLGANNFLGYRDFVDSNPGVVTTIQEPFKDQGNLTAIIPVDFGTASGVGIQRLCVCYEGGGCIGPPYFQEPAGYMRIRSALGGDRFLCQRGQNCLMTVRGAFLKITDKIAVMNGYLSDCKELDLSAVKSLPCSH